VKIRSWIRYFSQEDKLKGVAMVLLTLSVFFAPLDNPYGLGFSDYLPAAGYALLLAGVGLGHVFNFMSAYKFWWNPTRVILFFGGFAAALTVVFCGASLFFVFLLVLPLLIYWHFLDRDRQNDEIMFRAEIEAGREKDRKAAEEKSKIKKKKDKERPSGFGQ